MADDRSLFALATRYVAGAVEIQTRAELAVAICIPQCYNYLRVQILANFTIR
jgi:hypothetical protein